ncbi:MAG: NCS2 family permease [Firmicutes bacterium]|nr:NCS2 family permease [Bacillota bacterium]
MSFFEKQFKLKEHRTNTRTEIIAGITTFMTMAYIIVVNPGILTAAIDTPNAFQGVMTATILAAALTTILMGFVTNYPFALASGMGLNAFFAFTVAPIAGWEAALGAVLISGIAFFVLAITGIINWIDAAVPGSLKKAVAAGIGLFIALIGLKNAGMILPYPDTLVTLGDWTSPPVLLAIVGLAITAALIAAKIRGGILLGIIITTFLGWFFPTAEAYEAGAPLIGWFFGTGTETVTQIPSGLGSFVTLNLGENFSALGEVAFHLDFRGAISLGFMVLFALVFVDLFDTMGTLLGTGARAGFLDDKGRLPKVKQAMIVDAVGTGFGAVMGTSTVTTYVESTAGVSEGGRTGMTAVVTGALFLLALFFTPLALMIPGAATAPALIIVGVLMMGAISGINFEDFTEALPAFLTISFMPFTFSIADGIAIGFISYPLVKLVSGRGKEVNWFIYVLAAISLIHFFA